MAGRSSFVRSMILADGHTGVEADRILSLYAGIFYAQGCITYMAALQYAPRTMSRGRNLPCFMIRFKNDFQEFSQKPIDNAFLSTYTNGVCM